MDFLGSPDGTVRLLGLCVCLWAWDAPAAPETSTSVTRKHLIRNVRAGLKIQLLVRW